jgi:predicted nucleotidyltransferase
MQFKEEDLNIIYKVKVGSHAYGTNIPESDEDFKMVYLQKPEDVLNYGYQEQVNLSKDSTAYELRRYIELCCTGNPTMLELAYSPEDCIIYKHPIFDRILENKDKFLSKSCRWSFGGYAISQIQKASGLQKKMNWEKERVIRKNPIDFCWVVLNEKSSVQAAKGEIPLKQGVYPLKDWLEKSNLEQTDVVLNKLNHSK